MFIKFKKQVYENLLKQLIFLEENMTQIKESAISNQLFFSESDVQTFFQTYIDKIETLLKNAMIDDTGDKTLLPFIVIDSSFTLKDSNNHNHYCHLSFDLYQEKTDSFSQIYLLSKAGLDLLLKNIDSCCSVDLGNGSENYTIKSIWMS